MYRHHIVLFLLTGWVLACHSPVRDRRPGERAPLSAPCDPLDTLRCELPWPSNTFTVRDDKSATGLRLAVDTSHLPEEDDATFLNRADGFSRVAPILTGFAADIDPATLGDLTTGAVRLINAQHDSPSYGQAESLRLRLERDETHPGESLIVALPRRPLAPQTDYVVAVMDSLNDKDGNTPSPGRASLVALSLVKPTSAAEESLAAYHAPVRQALEAAHLDRHHVLRAWDFTTRSRDDAARRLLPMRSAMDDASRAGSLAVAIDTVELAPAQGIAAFITGRVTGLPLFLETDGHLRLDAAGLPQTTGAHEAPFRLVLPVSTGASYPVALYGHGTSGDYTDPAFDHELASAGFAKLAGRFIGWAGGSSLTTFDALGRAFLDGSALSTAGLLQALADYHGLMLALAGPLGDLVSAPNLGGQTNPLSGVRPDLNRLVWVGGSLGGTAGFVEANVEPSITAAVLNVPGAAWTHFVSQTVSLAPIRAAYAGSYGGTLDFQRLLYMSQGCWDEVDGAVWADIVPKSSRAFLVQESIGDPVLPNVSTEMVVRSLNASMVGGALQAIPDVPSAETVSGSSGVTQYRVSSTDPAAIHGFAARSGSAGEAARAQVAAFLRAVAAGAPVITLPDLCVDNAAAPGSCDFSSE